MTRGYVGDTVFAILPTVEAIHTLLLTVAVQLVRKRERLRWRLTLILFLGGTASALAKTYLQCLFVVTDSLWIRLLLVWVARA
jgi:hypothetical protein